MKLADILVAEDGIVQSCTDWRFYETRYALKIATIKSRKPEFDDSLLINQNIIKALCRLEHLSNWVITYVETLDKRCSDSSLPFFVRNTEARSLSAITQPLFIHLARSESVGDEDLEAILMPEDVNTLRYVKAVVICFPDRSNFYSEMAKQMIGKYGESVSVAIKAKAQEALSGASIRATPIADASIDHKAAPEPVYKSCCIA